MACRSEVKEGARTAEGHERRHAVGPCSPQKIAPGTDYRPAKLVVALKSSMHHPLKAELPRRMNRIHVDRDHVLGLKAAFEQ